MVKPVAGDDYATISVQDVDQQIAGSLLLNDTDPDNGALYLRFVNDIRVGDKGTDTIVGTYGTFTFNADGTYTYELDATDPDVLALAPGETLTEQLSYKISDGNGETDVGLFTLEITGPNQHPTATQDNFAVGVADDTLVGNVLLNDTDPEDDALQVSFIGQDSPLTYIPNDGSTVAYEGEYGTITIGRDGNFVYDIDETDAAVLALAPGETLAEIFTYKIWDGGVTNSADQDRIIITIGADLIL